MALDATGIRDELMSAAGTSGAFDAVVAHEPKSPPAPTGVTCAVFAGDATPVLSGGLAALSFRLEFTMRLYTAMIQEPADAIDPLLLHAADVLTAYLCADFQLSSKARYVDFLGADGERLRWVPGYVTQDSKPFRIIDIFVPVIINDLYPLTA
jgi:hypothetical protein